MSDIFKGFTPNELKSLDCYLYYDESSAPIAYALGQLDEISQHKITTGIHQGVRIGSATVLGALLLLLARTYRSVMFCLYELNFILMIISSGLELGWVFSFSGSMTQQLTNGEIPLSNLQLSVAATFFQMLLVISLLATLVMQINIACGDLNRKTRVSIVCLGAIACFPSLLIWFWRFVLVAIHNLGSNQGRNAYGTSENQWVYRGAWPAFAGSTSACSIILCIKLWLLHRRRYKLGLENFDPIKTLFTMAAQNSVIPAILAIIASALSPSNYSGQSISASIVPITATLLPFGYIMAQYNILQNTSQNDGKISTDFESQSISDMPKVQLSRFMTNESSN